MNENHKYSTYALAVIFTILMLAPQYHGWVALGNVFATYKNGGISPEIAFEMIDCNEGDNLRTVVKCSGANVDLNGERLK